MSTEQEKDELEQLMPRGLLDMLRRCPIPTVSDSLNQMLDSAALQACPPVIHLPDASEKPGE